MNLCNKRHVLAQRQYSLLTQMFVMCCQQMPRTVGQVFQKNQKVTGMNQSFSLRPSVTLEGIPNSIASAGKKYSALPDM